jgi:hypothetical protein
VRLISSAAHPDDRLAFKRKLFSSHIPTDSSCGILEVESTSHHSDYDHYHAVTLSDGYHVLFVDSSNGMLTLGCDAPIGEPTKLLRRIFFVPPEQGGVPKLYTAASDLTHGARIVAVYQDTIMLYSVPSDMIALSQLEQTGKNFDRGTCSSYFSKGNKHHWRNWLDENTPFSVGHQAEAEDPEQVWPVVIQGTAIGTLKGICEVAVQTRPEISIWALTYSLQCKCWRLRNYVDPIVRIKQYVCRNGIVHDSHSVDGNSDVIMSDTLPILPARIATSLLAHDGRDECAEAKRSSLSGLHGGVIKRMPRALATENDDWIDMIDVRGCADAWYDNDGDVVMCIGA